MATKFKWNSATRHLNYQSSVQESTMNAEEIFDFICIQCLFVDVCGPLLRSIIDQKLSERTKPSSQGLTKTILRPACFLYHERSRFFLRKPRIEKQLIFRSQDTLFYTGYELQSNIFFFYSFILESRKDKYEYVFSSEIRRKVDQLKRAHIKHLSWTESFQDINKPLFKRIAGILKEFSEEVNPIIRTYIVNRTEMLENLHDRVLQDRDTKAYENYWKLVECLLTVGNKIVNTMFLLLPKLLHFSHWKDLLDDEGIKHQIFHLLDLDECQFCPQKISKKFIPAEQWVMFYQTASSTMLTSKLKNILLENIGMISLEAKCAILCNTEAIQQVCDVDQEGACIFLWESYKYYVLNPKSTIVNEEEFQFWWKEMERISEVMSNLFPQNFTSDFATVQGLSAFSIGVKPNSKLKRITFEFPPLELTTYSHVRSKVVSLVRKGKLASCFDPNDLMILHSDEKRCRTLCLDIFNADPTFTDPGLTFEDIVQGENVQISCCIIKEHEMDGNSEDVLIYSFSRTQSKARRHDTSVARFIIYQELHSILHLKMEHLIKREGRSDNLNSSPEIPDKIERLKAVLSKNSEDRSKCKAILDLALKEGSIFRYYLGNQIVYLLGPQEPEGTRHKIEELGFRYKHVKTYSKMLHKPYYDFKPGSKVLNHNMKTGTLGMYAEFESNDFGYKYAMITHDHVAYKQKPISLPDKDDGVVHLGKCVWGKQTEDEDNVYDVAVTPVENAEIVERIDNTPKKDVVLYNDRTEKLMNCIVKKHGSSTGTTKGKVKYLSKDDDKENLESIIIRRGSNSIQFAEGGDSGAVVFRPEGHRLCAISSLVGGCSDSDIFETSSSSSEDAEEPVSESSSRSSELEGQIQGYRYTVTVPLNKAFERYNEKQRDSSNNTEEPVNNDEDTTARSRKNPQLNTKDGFYLEDS